MLRSPLMARWCGAAAALLCASIWATDANAQTCVQPTSGLVAWWPGDGDALDITGGNNGALQGGATFVPGMVAQAFSFNASTSEVVVLDSPVLSATGQITIAAWIKYASCTHPFGWCDVVSKAPNGQAVTWNYGLIVNRDSGQMAFVNGNGTSWFAQYAGPNLKDNTWHHVAVTYGSGLVKYYVDGSLVFSATNNVPLTANTANLEIGRNSGEGGAAFGGQVDEVQIYSSVLTQTDIQAIVNAGSAGVCKTPGAFVYEILHSFSAAPDGSSPVAGLVQGSDGNFYGTTWQGGAANLGTIFTMDPSGSVTILHSFVGNDGANPSGHLIQATDGNFYGTTAGGGASGNGTVFRVTVGGALTVLHSFTGGDGSSPESGVIQATDANLYGTTLYGGTLNTGTAFKISTAGMFTSLHSFGTAESAYYPNGGIIQATDGNFYGTTYQGGTSGPGTAYRMTSAGAVSILHSFNGSGDGGTPYAGLLQAADGNFYGTTIASGPAGFGTAFKMTSTGTFTVLHAFSASDGGYYPYDTLIQGRDGNLYGTANAQSGTVFAMTESGTLTLLHAFAGGPTDGSHPQARLLQTADGRFYGTTSAGGPGGGGVIFRLTPKAPTSITVTSSKNPSTVGQVVTFTAAMSGGGDNSGTLTFKADGSPLNCNGGSGRTGSVATCSSSVLTAGNHVITVEYRNSPTYGDGNGTLSGGQTVNATTSIAVASSANPSTFGQVVTFTASMSGGGDNSGTVTFKADGSPLNCNGGSGRTGSVANCSTSVLTAGVHVITVEYRNSTNYGDGDGTLTGGQSVSKRASSTVVGASGVFGGSVVLSATVSGTGAGGGNPGNDGQITFKVGGVAPAGCSGLPLSANQASCSTAAYNSGSQVVTAEYRNAANFADSNGTLVRTPVSITVTSSVNPSTFGDVVKFTAGLSVTLNSGTLTFKADGAPLNCNGGSSGGGPSTVATCSSNVLTIGTHALTAEFTNSAAFLDSVGTLTGGQTVNKVPTSTVVASSRNPSTFGEAVIFTATVTASSGNPGSDGGVTFKSDGTAIASCGNVPLNAGQATCMTASLHATAPFAHGITAEYGNAVSFTSSVGTLAGGQTVNRATASFSSLASPAVSYGTAVTTLGGRITAGSLIPTGVVRITVNGITLGANVQADGTFFANFSTASFGVAGSPYPITYDYLSDTNDFNEVVDSTTTFTVSPAPVTASISGGPFTWDGSPHAATITLNPASVAYTVTYLGTTTAYNSFAAPTAADTYTVTLAITDSNYALTGSSTGSITILRASQSISVTAPPPPTAAIFDAFEVTATATSGLTVAINASGACSGTGSGSATITMIAGSGACTIAFTQGGNGDYEAAVPVTRVVNAVNTPPLANSQTGGGSVITSENTSVAITLSGSDVDSPGLTFEIVDGPSAGQLGAIGETQCAGAGAGSTCTAKVTYTPNTYYYGADSFTFRVTDDAGASSAVARVDITVNHVEQPPVAYGQAVTTAKNTPATVTLTAKDVDTTSMGFAIVGDPLHGTLGPVTSATCTTTVSGTNCQTTVLYTPTSYYFGADSFTFKAVNDLESNVATVAVTVQGSDESPTADNISATVASNVPVTIPLSAADHDSPSLSFVVVSGPSHGTLAIGAAVCVVSGLGSTCTESVVYTPANGYTGPDSFTYAANDGLTDSNLATVTITVTGNAIYTFQGFLAPVANPTTVNTAQASQAIPQKWQLLLNGQAVSDPTSFVSVTSYQTSCGVWTNEITSPVNEVASGSSGLQYLGDGTWQFNWKTDKSWADTCRTSVLQLKDGSTHEAYFQFKK